MTKGETGVIAANSGAVDYYWIELNLFANKKMQ